MDCSTIFGTRKWLVDCQVFILEYYNTYYSHTSLHILRSNSLCLEEAGSVWKVSDGNSWKYDHQVTVTCIGGSSSPSGANVEHEDHQEKVLDMKTLTIIVLASLLILTSLALIGVVIWSRSRMTASTSEQEVEQILSLNMSMDTCMRWRVTSQVAMIPSWLQVKWKNVDNFILENQFLQKVHV